MVIDTVEQRGARNELESVDWPGRASVRRGLPDGTRQSILPPPSLPPIVFPLRGRGGPLGSSARASPPPLSHLRSPIAHSALLKIDQVGAGERHGALAQWLVLWIAKAGLIK